MAMEEIGKTFYGQSYTLLEGTDKKSIFREEDILRIRVYEQEEKKSKNGIWALFSRHYGNIPGFLESE